MRTVLTVVGTVVGAYFGYPQLGALLGSLVGAALEPDPPDRFGPRLEDRRVQISSYGAPVPYLFGTTRVAGNVVWADELEEVVTEDELDSKGGPSQTIVSYSYYATFAVLLGFGPLRGFRRIWADAVLIYDGANEGVPASDFDIAFYPGDEAQLPDPTIEALLGVDNTPAFRGFGYLVLGRLPLERFGNRIPSMTIECLADGEWSGIDTTLGSAASFVWHGAVQRLDGQIVAYTSPSVGVTRLSVIDPSSGAVTLSEDHGIYPESGGNGSIIYVPPTNQVWVADIDGNLDRYDAATLAHVGTTPLPLNATVGAYDPVYRRVIVHRATAGGPNSLNAIDLDGNQVFELGVIGLGFCLQVVCGGSAVFLGVGAPGTQLFGVMRHVMYDDTDAVVAIQSASGGAIGRWDPLRHRYVVFGGSVYTVSDADPPTITEYNPAGYSVASIADVQYVSAVDGWIVWSQIVGLVQMQILDATTFEVLHTEGSINSLGVVRAFLSPGDAGTAFLLGSTTAYEVQFFGSTVGAAVARLCEESGLEAADYDVSELTQRLRGYIVGQQAAARGAIEQLALAFQFEGVELDDELYFRRRGGASVATITSDECGAGVDQPARAPVPLTRGDEIDLPARMAVTAPDPALDHQPNTQYGERLARFAGEQKQASLAVVLSADENKRLADALLFDLWASRERGTVSLTRKHARLAPTDVITLDGRRARVHARSDEGAVIRIDWVADDADVVTQSASGVASDFVGQEIAVQVPTSLIVLDISLLRDADNDPGAYGALWGVAPYWRGSALLASDDDEATWEREATLGRPGSSVGVATNALANFPGGHVFDEASSLNVSMRNGAPSSATRAAVLAGSNHAAVEGPDGWEIIQYRDATLEADGTYTLTGLLRGRRGTEWAIAGHAAGDRVVLLSETTIRSIDIESSLIGVERTYRPVSVGDTIAQTSGQDITITAERLKPFSPVDLRAARNVATGDITLSWKRRTRLSCRFTGTGGINVPLGETSQEYEVEIYSSGSYATVVRTFTGLASAQATYTAAQQTTDFGSTQSTVYARVYQISAAVDRGHALEAAA